MSDERPVQYLSDDYLEHCRRMTTAQICEFLEDYRVLVLAAGHRAKRRAISIRIEEPLLRAFRRKAKAAGVPYQTQIHRLMEDWVRIPEEA